MIRIVVEAVFLTCAGVAVAGGLDYLALNVLPFSPGREEVVATDAIRYAKRTGNDIVLYSLSLHPQGNPAEAKLMRMLESYRTFAACLEGTNVRAGILIQSLLGHRSDAVPDATGWPKAVNIEGTGFRRCPSDPAFLGYVYRLAREVAKARPAFVLTDDDIRAYSHDAECFCAHHVALLNDRLGTDWSADEARAAVRDSMIGDRTYETFLSLQREMIDNVARTLRAGFDSVDPTLRCGTSMPGEEPRWAADAACLLAARGQPPTMRVCNGLYLEGAPKTLYANVLRTHAKIALAAGRVPVLIEEADTYPQNLWSKSAVSFYSKSIVSVMCGMTGVKLWFVGAHAADGTPVDEKYLDILARHRGQLPALVRALRGMVPAGLAVPLSRRFNTWHPAGDHAELGCCLPTWADRFAGPFGLPFFATENLSMDVVYTLMGRANVAKFTDEQLLALFRGRLLVDGEAALALCERGFSREMGVCAEKASLSFDGECVAGGARLRFRTTPGTPRLVPLTGASVLSTLVAASWNGEADAPVAPGAVFFANAGGGRVVTTAFHANVSAGQSLNDGRKTWLLVLLNKLGWNNVHAENAQHVLVQERVRKDGTEVVSVTNLGYDPLTPVKLSLPEGLRSDAVMDVGGLWLPMRDVNLAACETAVFRLKRVKADSTENKTK